MSKAVEVPVKRLNYLNTIAFVILFILIALKGIYYIHHYTMDCVVVDVEAQNVVVEDTTGNVWEFYGNDYLIGDKISVTFYDNGTDNRKDDIIEKVEL